MTASAKLSDDDPIVLAWDRFQHSMDYKNAQLFYNTEVHRRGGLWGAFLAGWLAGSGEEPEYSVCSHEGCGDPVDDPGDYCSRH